MLWRQALLTMWDAIRTCRLQAQVASASLRLVSHVCVCVPKQGAAKPSLTQWRAYPPRQFEAHRAEAKHSTPDATSGSNDKSKKMQVDKVTKEEASGRIASDPECNRLAPSPAAPPTTESARSYRTEWQQTLLPPGAPASSSHVVCSRDRVDGLGASSEQEVAGRGSPGLLSLGEASRLDRL